MERLVDVTLKQRYIKNTNTTIYSVEFVIPNLNATTEKEHSYTDVQFSKRIDFDEFQNIVLFHDLLNKANLDNQNGVVITNCKCEYGIRRNKRTGEPYKAIFITLSDDVSIAFFVNRYLDANLRNKKMKTDYIWEETTFSNNAVNALDAFEESETKAV